MTYIVGGPGVGTQYDKQLFPIQKGSFVVLISTDTAIAVG